jgi:hypothetical protein
MREPFNSDQFDIWLQNTAKTMAALKAFIAYPLGFIALAVFALHAVSVVHLGGIGCDEFGRCTDLSCN